MASKLTGGRNKMKLEKIEDEKERGVTLSKRHIGVFKKASELATLCGAQILIILFTIGGRPLCFGSPDIFTVISKFLNPGLVYYNEHDFYKRFAASYNEMKLHMLNQEFNELNEKLNIERKQGELIKKILKVLLGGKTYDEYLWSIGIDGLMNLKYKLEVLKRKLECRDGSTSGSASSSDKYKVDLSKIEGPKDYLKLY